MIQEGSCNKWPISFENGYVVKLQCVIRRAVKPKTFLDAVMTLLISESTARGRKRGGGSEELFNTKVFSAKLFTCYTRESDPDKPWYIIGFSRN